MPGSPRRPVSTPAEPRWLLLHQIPRQPDYLRVKVWRRLQRLGAVSIKNAVYALPRSEERNEDLQWVDRKSTRLNSSHSQISYAVFCLKKKKPIQSARTFPDFSEKFSGDVPRTGT